MQGEPESVAALRRGKQTSKKRSGPLRPDSARQATARKQIRLLSASVVIALVVFASVILSWIFFEPDDPSAEENDARAIESVGLNAMQRQQRTRRANRRPPSRRRKPFVPARLF